jgi:hypothetical protein
MIFCLTVGGTWRFIIDGNNSWRMSFLGMALKIILLIFLMSTCSKQYVCNALLFMFLIAPKTYEVK